MPECHAQWLLVHIDRYKDALAKRTIGDEVEAIAFMKQFYTYLQTLPRDEALRHTQLDCLHNKIQLTGITNTSNPIYWAGFNLYGESEHLF